MMDENTKAQIIDQLVDIIVDVMPDAKMVDKYGGVMVERIAGRADTQCCGYFAYKKHVSLEFTNGTQLTDPDNILEGKGKYRRHVKLYSVQDLTVKQCKDFLEQACNL